MASLCLFTPIFPQRDEQEQLLHLHLTCHTSYFQSFQIWNYMISTLRLLNYSPLQLQLAFPQIKLNPTFFGCYTQKWQVPGQLIIFLDKSLKTDNFSVCSKFLPASMEIKGFCSVYEKPNAVCQEFVTAEWKSMTTLFLLADNFHPKRRQTNHEK
ncbi:hypothetical protein QQP08_016951, partial [Theobroma cacao]